MKSLDQIFSDRDHFARGVELVTTRGTMEEARAITTRHFARELAGAMPIDWVSITDNAGGNPQLSPLALGKSLLYGGKEVLIHLSCKDMNRNGLESAAWEMASEGFNNILAMTGDYPVSGYSGAARPVFDIDSVGLVKLLQDMNNGLGVPVRNGGGSQLGGTSFYTGVVATNFKLLENELVPQLLKLKKKIETGARFVVAQIGFDSRKSSELIEFMRNAGMGNIPLIGNVFIMSARLAEFFRTGKIAGVVVADEWVDLARRHAGAQCLNAREIHQTTRQFVELLHHRAGRTNDDIIVDPGLAPISADTYGLVNMSLDAIRLIRADPDLDGIHISVGLTNFSFGVPRNIREGLENAYITLATEAGLDYILGNPEKALKVLDPESRYLKVVREALQAGRPMEGESQEMAGYRQSEKIMDLFDEDDR